MGRAAPSLIGGSGFRRIYLEKKKQKESAQEEEKKADQTPNAQKAPK